MCSTRFKDQLTPRSLHTIKMASLFDSLPSAGLRTRSKTSTTSSSSDNDRMLNWVQDDEKSNCMHCNTPFTLLTRKVRKQKATTLNDAKDLYHVCAASLSPMRERHLQ